MLITFWSRQIKNLSSKIGIIIWPGQILDLPRPNKNFNLDLAYADSESALILIRSTTQIFMLSII